MALGDRAPRPSVRVGRWTLRQGGRAYGLALVALTLAILGVAVALLPHTLMLAAFLLRARFGVWLPLALPVALAPFIVLHEGSHIAIFRAAVMAVVPVAVPRRVALVAALAPQPVVLGLAALARLAPAQWPLWLFLAVLAVAGSAGDFLSAAALALSRDEAVVAR